LISIFDLLCFFISDLHWAAGDVCVIQSTFEDLMR
jgi:hypothetical protein